MLVRQVKHQGQFRWKKQDVFLSEVLWGEPVGLLAEDERWYTVYFARFPIARFDSRQLRVLPLKKPKSMIRLMQGKENRSPSPDPIPSNQRRRKCQGCARSKMSGFLPAVHRKMVPVRQAMT